MPRVKRYADNAARLKAWRETKRNDTPVKGNETELQTETIPPAETIPPSIEVALSSSSTGSGRQALRDRLDAYKVNYVAAAKRQDWTVCERVNQDRELLFYELWELEKGLSPEKRYWMPARVISQGHIFQPENVRRGHA